MLQLEQSRRGSSSCDGIAATATGGPRARFLVKLPLLADVTRVGHGDVALGIAKLRVVGVEGLVPVVQEVTLRVVQSRVRVVINLSIPKKNISKS